MTQQNEAIRLAIADLTDSTAYRYDKVHRHSVDTLIEVLRPLLDQTSAGVGDDPIELNVERIVQIAAAHENYKEYIKVEDGIGISYHTLSEGRLCDFARDVVAEYVAANTRALTQADQPADKAAYRDPEQPEWFNDLTDLEKDRAVEIIRGQTADKDERRDLLDKIDRTLDYFRDEFPAEKDVWDEPISAYAGGISANDLLEIKRALPGSDGRE